MKHVHLFLYQTLSMCYVPGTELVPADIDMVGTALALKEFTIKVKQTAQKQLQYCMTNATIKDTENTEEHLTACAREPTSYQFIVPQFQTHS